jgi:cytochrome P450
LDPPPELLRILRQDPVARVTIWDGSEPWVITGYDDVRAILTDARVSADSMSPGYPQVSEGDAATRNRERAFISVDDPEHALYRRMLASEFTIRRMEQLRPMIQHVVDHLIDAMLAGPTPADLVEAFCLQVPTTVICGLLGVPYEDHRIFQEASKTIMSRDSTPEESLQAAEEMLDYLSRMLDAKATDPGDDLFSRLAVRGGRLGLPVERLAVTARLLLQAGHETTANMIALGTLALMLHPGQFAELRDTQDPLLVASAVEELLRYLSVSHAGRRRAAVERIDIGGRQIAPCEGIIALTDTANRDATAFPDPDRLDIRRDQANHLAFGYGVHQCLGQPLARVELQVVFGTLLRRIPSLSLACSLEDLEFKDGMTVYGVYSLPVTW